MSHRKNVSKLFKKIPPEKFCVTDYINSSFSQMRHDSHYVGTQKASITDICVLNITKQSIKFLYMTESDFSMP
jgi:hypothetical protein